MAVNVSKNNPSSQSFFLINYLAWSGLYDINFIQGGEAMGIYAPSWSGKFVVLIKKANFQLGRECWLGLWTLVKLVVKGWRGRRKAERGPGDL